MAIRLIYDCWAVLLAVWLISALRVKRTAEREPAREWIRHRLPLWCAYLLLLAPALDFTPLRLGIIAQAAWVPGAGVGLTALGLILCLWARFRLGGNWSATVTVKQGHTLVTAGPYRWIRNPIYTGMLLMFVGTALVVARGRGWLAVALLLAALAVKIRQEERFMLRQFPREFPAYRQRSWALVPFVY